MSLTKGKLNPGSTEAIEEGCTCPVLDNCHGKGIPMTEHDEDMAFWITAGCPLHGIAEFAHRELESDQEESSPAPY